MAPRRLMTVGLVTVLVRRRRGQRTTAARLVAPGAGLRRLRAWAPRRRPRPCACPCPVRDRRFWASGPWRDLESWRLEVRSWKSKLALDLTVKVRDVVY